MWKTTRDLIGMTKLKLNLGPQHPSTHGVLRLILELEGEKILSCEPDVGYLHRGMEKMAEKLSYVQYLPLVDRIDYLSGFFYSELLCRTVEKALNIELKDRARAIKVMMLELNRIASHLLWIGAFLMDLGATSKIHKPIVTKQINIAIIDITIAQTANLLNDCLFISQHYLIIIHSFFSRSSLGDESVLNELMFNNSLTP